MTQPTLIGLHSNEYSQEFYYYPSAVILDRCLESWNTYLIKYLFELKGRFKSKSFQYDYRNKWIKNIHKAYYANVSVDLMEENVIQVNVVITINVDVSVYKNKIYVKKIIFGILLPVAVKMEYIDKVLLMI